MLNNKKGSVKKNILIGLGILVVIFIILIFLGYQYTKGMKENANNFFNEMQKKNFSGAYSLTSKDFQKATPLKDFKKQGKLADNLADIEWESEESAGPNSKQLDGLLVIKNGSKMPISVTMIKEEDNWLVLAVNPQKPEVASKVEKKKEKQVKKDSILPDKLPSYSWGLSWTSAKISEAFMTKNPEGKIVTKTDVFSSNSDKIFCMVKVSNAPDDTDVTAKWIFLEGPVSKFVNYEIGAESRKTKKGAHLYFGMTRPLNGFPKGNYVVGLYVDGKKQTTLSFKVK